jgi:hypothetical protein
VKPFSLQEKELKSEESDYGLIQTDACQISLEEDWWKLIYRGTQYVKCGTGILGC